MISKRGQSPLLEGNQFILDLIKNWLKWEIMSMKEGNKWDNRADMANYYGHINLTERIYLIING